MGIAGLLPLIKSTLVPKHLKDFGGQTIGIDAYVWLHKGAYTCAQELALGQPTAKYVTYCMNKVKLLQHYGIKPYIVFDGGPLPSKGGTETDRAAKRQAALQKANAFLAAGNSSAARDEFVKAVDVTPAMAYQFIKSLKAEDIDYVVAPYEADAQLAFLARKGLVDAIISEDSDLVVYGCPVILFKLDPAGSVIEYRRDRLTTCAEYSFHHWTDDRLRHMAIISGCDYLDGLPGLGVKSAYALFKQHTSSVKVISAIRMQGKVKVPQYYDRDFRRADLTFQHQRVFDPTTRQAVHLKPLPSKGMSASEVEAVGGLMTTELALGIAIGDMDPSTGEAMIDINASLAVSPVKALSKSASNGSFYKAKEKKPVVAAGPLDSFFGALASTAVASVGPEDRTARKPAMNGHSTKRPALDELKPNVPIKRKSLTPEPSVKVSSRFFGNPSPQNSPRLGGDDPDEDEMSALLEMEGSIKNETSASAISSATSSQATVVVETTGASVSESCAEWPTSEMVGPPSSPSPRKRRKLIEAAVMKKEATPVKVEEAKKEASSPRMHSGSMVSSPEKVLTTPTRKLVSDWNQRFKRDSSSSGQSRRSLGHSQTLSKTLAPASSSSALATEPPTPKVKPVSPLRVKAPPVRKTKSPVVARKPVAGQITSKERPLSSFAFRRQA